MKCIDCGGPTRTIDSRLVRNRAKDLLPDGTHVRRRRHQCDDCGLRFSTYELLDEHYEQLIDESRKYRKAKKKEAQP